MKQLITSVIAITTWWCIGLATAQSVVVLQETSEYRPIQHAAGETEIPLRPSRIVTLHNVFVEGLLSFGQQPVGTVVRDIGFPPQLLDKLDLTAVQSVGDQNSPSLEAILALQPDLILGQAQIHAELYDQLAAIAPTLLIAEPDDDWRPWLVILATVLGDEAAAQAALDAYDAKAAAAREQLTGHAAETVLLLRVRDRDIRVYGGARRSGPVLYQDLQLTPHPLVPLDENHMTISLEVIPELTADHLFLMVEDEERMSSIEETALWQSLPAVQAGRVYRVELDPWNRSVGVISFGRIIDDVLVSLLEETP
jgi:iron complex transport system substrate-binding protein